MREGVAWLVGLAVDREETRLAHEGERADRDGAHVPGDAALEGGGRLLRRRAVRPQAEEGEHKDRIDGDGGAGGEAQRRDVSQRGEREDDEPHGEEQQRRATDRQAGAGGERVEDIANLL